MKRRGLTLLTLVTLLVVAAAFTIAAPALAEKYDYKVRVFPGNRGTLSADPVEVTVPKGGDVNLYDVATATITDDRYVQTGFRLSGTDEVRIDGKVNGVSEDMDFVVAYGVKANTIEYTIKYVEYGTGKELAKPKTFYGKVGDKPVAAYEFVEGYRPLYLAITGTLTDDGENVWTFEYAKLAEGETIETTTTNTNTRYVTNTTGGGQNGTTTVVNETAGGGETTETTTGTTTTTGTDQTGTEGGAQNAEGQNAGTTEPGIEGGEDQTPPPTQEILDMDTPLAGPGSETNAASAAEEGSRLITNPVAIAGVAIAIAGGLGVLLYFANRKKKEQKDEEEA